MNYFLVIECPDMPIEDQNPLLAEKILKKILKDLKINGEIFVSFTNNKIFINIKINNFQEYDLIKGPSISNEKSKFFKEKYKEIEEKDGYYYGKSFLPNILERSKEIAYEFLDNFPWSIKARWTNEKKYASRPIINIECSLDENLVEGHWNGVHFTAIKNFNHKNFEKRKNEIQKILSKYSIFENKNLEKKLCFLIENPEEIVATFHEKFLELPEDIIKYYIAKENLGFLTKDGIKPKNQAIILCEKGKKLDEKNFSFSIECRLLDILMSYQRDLSRNIDFFIEKNKKKILHEKIGNIEEKTKRVKSLFYEIFENSEKNQCLHLIDNYLLDTCSEITIENANLQGIIAEKFFPNLPIREIFTNPKKTEAKIVFFLDRLDTLIEFSKNNILPTGDKDPFGLKKVVDEISNLLINDFDFLLEKILKKIGKANNFFLKRYVNILSEKNENFRFIKLEVIGKISITDVEKIYIDKEIFIRMKKILQKLPKTNKVEKINLDSFEMDLKKIGENFQITDINKDFWHKIFLFLENYRFSENKNEEILIYSERLNIMENLLEKIEKFIDYEKI